MENVTVVLKGGVVYVVNKTNPNIKVTIMDYDIDDNDEQADVDSEGNKCIISIE